MPVDPRIQQMLSTMHTPQPVSSGDAAEMRATAHAFADQSTPLLTDPGPAMASVVDEEVPVQDGRIRVRIYRPSDNRPLPSFVYLHGGGWWQGTLDRVDAFCRRLSETVHCIIVSVDFRLAPEYQFPIPLEDCYAALAWVVANADHMGVDPHRVSIGGVSAGGNLAAAVALMARDRGGPQIVAQVLEVPAVDLTLSQRPSTNLVRDTGSPSRNFSFVPGSTSASTPMPQIRLSLRCSPNSTACLRH